jgi:Reverse transcriptase (RNA-dependent DNA polymerase)
MINFVKSCNKTRIIKTSVDNYASAFRPTLSTPLGAVLSPTCFNLDMDELLENLGKGEMGCLRSAEVIGFADDIMIIIPFNPSCFDEAYALANKKMERMRSWSLSKGLKINPSKTSYAIMHRGNSDKVDEEAACREIKCDGKIIERKKEFWYLGIWMDEKMTWNRQLEEARKKGCKTLIATSRMLGKTFGLSPYLTKWVHQSICLPRMTYEHRRETSLTGQMGARPRQDRPAPGRNKTRRAADASNFRTYSENVRIQPVRGERGQLDKQSGKADTIHIHPEGRYSE